jgi:hypothetical protein
MVLNKKNSTEPPSEIVPDAVGARIGFGIVAVVSLCLILGFVFAIFCPDTYAKLQAILPWQ